MVNLIQASGSDFYIVEGTAPRDVRFGFLYFRNTPNDDRVGRLALADAWNNNRGHFVFFDVAGANVHPILAKSGDVLGRLDSDMVLSWFDNNATRQEYVRWDRATRKTKEEVSVDFRDYQVQALIGTLLSLVDDEFCFTNDIEGDIAKVVVIKRNYGTIPLSSAEMRLAVIGPTANQLFGELSLGIPSGRTYLGLDALDVGCRYFYPTGNSLANNPTLTSQRFCPFVLPANNTPIAVWMALDYFRPDAEGSYFAFSNPRLPAVPQRILSSFRTMLGYQLRLETTADAKLVFSDKATLSASAHDYYLAPVGTFVIDHVMDPYAADLLQDPPSLPDQTLRLRCGLNGTEYIQFDRGDLLNFRLSDGGGVANSPVGNAYYDPAEIKKSSFDPDLNDYLLPKIRTPWVSIYRTALDSSPQYFAQPDEAPTYRPNGLGSLPKTLDFAERVIIDLSPEHSFPLVSAEGFRPRTVLPHILDGAMGKYRLLESQGLYAQRRKQLKAPAKLRRNALTNDAPFDTITPQGLRLTLRDRDYYDTLTFAKAEPQEGSQYDFFEFRAFGENPELVEAFARNQICLLMTNVPPDVDFTSNRIGIRNWFFEAKLASPDQDVFSARDPILIFKYYDRPFVTFDDDGGVIGGLIQDPAVWADGDFLGEDKSTLIARLTTIVQRIYDMAEKGTPEEKDLATGIYQKIISPTWNGVLAFNAPIIPTAIPPSLKSLVAGINVNNFIAQHVGINCNRFDVVGNSVRINIDESSLFALIDYGSSGTPTPDPAEDFLFNVDRLQVLFENSEIQRFSAQITLTAFNLFGQPTLEGEDEVVLIGRYECRDGIDTYSFVYESTDPEKAAIRFPVDGYVIESVDIRRAELLTTASDTGDGSGLSACSSTTYVLSVGNDAGEIESTNPLSTSASATLIQQALGGLGNVGANRVQVIADAETRGVFKVVFHDALGPNMRLRGDGLPAIVQQPPGQNKTWRLSVASTIVDARFQLNGALNFGAFTQFDLFSFEKLEFTNLAVGMRFRICPQGGKIGPKFFVESGALSLDVESSLLRRDSWANLFPIRLRSIVFSPTTGKLNFKSLGFTQLFGDAEAQPIDFSFGLVFDVDLGSLGSLKPDPDGFYAQLMLGWNTEENSIIQKLVGIKIPESRGGSKEIGINGVLKLLIKKFYLKHFDASNAVPEHFLIGLIGCQFEVFGSAFPQDRDSLHVWLFPNMGSPSKGRLGWYVGYDNPDPDALQYLGAGQRLGLSRDAKSFTTLFDALHTFPSNGPSEDPPNPFALTYDPKQDWTVVLKFEPTDGVTLGAVFHDPKLYSLLVDVVNGIRVEISYRKVTDDIGVYSTEVGLPKSLRNLDFGYFVITIPHIGIDVYTNGNYRIDVGFPVNFDFRRSFKMQAFPFIGAGGMYFARLNGKTSNLLPGSYSLVVQAGFAGRLGIGREGSWGILEFGVSLSFYGILEGAIGVDEGGDLLHPTSYLVRGEFGVIGELYGTIDFSIIKASVLVRIRAGAGLQIEKDHGVLKPMIVFVEAGVDAEVSVVIGRIRVFGRSIEVSVTCDYHAVVHLEWELSSDRLLDKGPQQLNWGAALLLGEERLAAAQETVDLFFLPGMTVGFTRTGPNKPLAVALTALEMPVFDKVVSETLQLLLRSYHNRDTAKVEVADLVGIQRRLKDPGSWLSYTQIKEMLKQKFKFNLTGGVREGDGNNEPQSTMVFFPVLPDLTLTHDNGSGGTIDVDFATTNPRPESYQACLSEYFADAFAKSTSSGGRAARSAATASMATYSVEAYFNFICNHAVQDAIDRSRRANAAPLTFAEFVGPTDNRELAGMLTLFFYGGLRVPSNFGANCSPQGDEFGLYEMTGQQFEMRIPSDQNNNSFAWKLDSKDATFIDLDPTHPPEITRFDRTTLLELIGRTYQPQLSVVTEIPPLKKEIKRFEISQGFAWQESNLPLAVNRATVCDGGRSIWMLPQALLEELESFERIVEGKDGKRGLHGNSINDPLLTSWQRKQKPGAYELVVLNGDPGSRGRFEIEGPINRGLSVSKSSAGKFDERGIHFRIAQQTKLCLYRTTPSVTGISGVPGSSADRLVLEKAVTFEANQSYYLRISRPTGGLISGRYAVLRVIGGKEVVLDRNVYAEKSGSCFWEFEHVPSIPAEKRRWGTAVELNIRQLPGVQDGVEFESQLFEIAGMNEQNRRWIDRLFSSHGGSLPAGLTAHLLYADSNTPLALRSDASSSQSGNRVSIVRTNLSDESNPPSAIRLGSGTTGEFVADLVSVDDFLRMIWRGSIVNSGRYYLYYPSVDPNDPNSNPLHVLFQPGTVQVPIKLVIEYAADADETYKPYYNCALINHDAHPVCPAEPRPNAGAGPRLHAQIFTGSAFDSESEEVDDFVAAYEASLEPGCVAFKVDRTLFDIPLIKPAGMRALAADYNAEFDALYSLASYQVIDNSAGDIFRPIEHTLPITSKVSGSNLWSYEQAVPLYGTAPNASRYVGIGQSVDIRIRLRDLYGNEYPGNPDAFVSSGSLTHRYFDALIPISEWPDVQSSLRFDSQQDLVVRLLFNAPTIVTGLTGKRGSNNQRLHVPELAKKNLAIVGSGSYWVVVENATQDLVNGVYKLVDVEEFAGNSNGESVLVLDGDVALGPAGSCTFSIVAIRDVSLLKEKFERIADQLRDSNASAETTASWSAERINVKSSLSSFVDDILFQLERMVTGRATTVSDIEIEATLPVPQSLLPIEDNEAPQDLTRRPIFEFKVGVEIYRDPNAAFHQIEGQPFGPAQKVQTNFALEMGDRSALIRFATDFEAWVPGLLFAVGTRAQRESGPPIAGAAKPDFDGKVAWLVYTATPADVVQLKEPVVFAPRPISTKLLSAELDVDDPQTAKPIKKQVVDVDVDELAKRCFETVERVLMSQGLLQFIERTGGKNALASLLSDKKVLSTELAAKYLIPLFEEPPLAPGAIDPAVRLAEARRRFEQSLLIDLRHFYDTDVVYQFDAATSIQVNETEGLTFLGEVRTNALPTGSDGKRGSANNKFAADGILDWTQLNLDQARYILIVSVDDPNNSSIVPGTYRVLRIEPSELTLDVSFANGVGADRCQFELRKLPEGDDGRVGTDSKRFASDRIDDWEAYGVDPTKEDYSLVIFDSPSANDNGVYPIVSVVAGEIIIDGELAMSSGDRCKFRVTGGRAVEISPVRFNVKPSTPNVPSSLLIDVKNSSARDEIAVDFNYVLNYIEHQIQPSEDEYRPSSWLSLVNPKSVTLSTQNIPIPLRGYPQTPQINAHDFEQLATFRRIGEPIPDLESKADWDYLFSYSAALAAQDEVRLQVDLNQRASQGLMGAGVDGVLAALVNFTDHFPSADAVFKELQGNNPAQSLAKLTALFASVRSSFERVADRVSAEPLEYVYYVNEEPSPNDPNNQTRVTIRWDDNVPFEAQIAKGSLAAGDSALTDSFDDPAIYGALDVRRRVVRIRGLNVLHEENACAGISLTRNRDLGGKTPVVDFIYETPWSFLPDSLTPQILVSELLPIQPSYAESGDDGVRGASGNNFLSSARVDFSGLGIPANSQLRISAASGDLIEGVFNIDGFVGRELRLSQNIATGPNGTCQFQILPPLEHFLVAIFQSLFPTRSLLNHAVGGREMKVELRFGDAAPVTRATAGPFLSDSEVEPPGNNSLNKIYFPLSLTVPFMLDPQNITVSTPEIITMATIVRDWWNANIPARSGFLALDLEFKSLLSSRPLPTLRLKRLEVLNYFANNR